MKKLVAGILISLIGLTMAFAQEKKEEVMVNIGAEGQQCGTITDYLMFNLAATMPTPMGYDHDGLTPFNCLTMLLKQTGLDNTFAEKGPDTLFAPTDEAFKTFAKQNQEKTGVNFMDWDANTEAVKRVLTYHVLPESRTLNTLNVETVDNVVTFATVEKSNMTINFAGADENKTNTNVSFGVDPSDPNVSVSFVEGQTLVDNCVVIPINNVFTVSGMYMQHARFIDNQGRSCKTDLDCLH